MAKSPGKSRSEKGTHTKPPTKRASRAARPVGRQDQESGVSSRARSRVQGTERTADPRKGARSGHSSKGLPKSGRR